jgi:DNA-binding NarL/FixJ family response regulator
VSTRILIADDHNLVRQGLKEFLQRQEGMQVVCEAADGPETVQMAEKYQPDVAIIDISMPGLNGMDAAREIKRSLQDATRVILLTQHEEDQYVVEAMRAGVQGYVLKSQAAKDLVHAIEEVSRGFVYLSPSISRAVVDAYLSEMHGSGDALSGRELQVVQLIGEGKSSKEIASQMGISVKTVESHKARVMRKLNVHGTASLVRYAIRRGLIQP